MNPIQAYKRYRMYAKTLGLGYLTSRRQLGDGVVSADTRFGRLFFRPADSDLKALWQTLGAREYDMAGFPQAAAVDTAYEAMLASGRTPVIIDAGANIGSAAIWFSERFPQARIVAVEPDPANADLCRRNNAQRNVEVVEAAIGAEPGNVSLVPSDQAWGVRTERGGAIPVVTVDELLARVPNGALLLVKVDIEGFEADLFAANTGWIDKTTAVIIEPHDWMLPGEGASRSFRQSIGPDFDLLISGENLIFIRGPGSDRDNQEARP